MLNASLALILLALPMGLYADLYMWTDKNGITHICDELPTTNGTLTNQPQKLAVNQSETNQGIEEAALREADRAFDSENFGEALTLFKPLANSGNPRAQNTLGLIYGRGLGVQKDLAAAFMWHRKAARQGYASAQYYMGLMYSDGQGVARNSEEAFKWICKAAEQGLSEAQFTLGTMYANGEGTRKDSRQAARWYREAADQGHAFAQHNLALMYAKGDGVVRDEIAALRWEKKAAALGDPFAQHRLATLYATGQSVLKNYEEATVWFREAFARGYPLSLNLAKDWSLGHYFHESNYFVIEFIKTGDNIDNWKELVQIQVFRGHRGGATPEEFVENLRTVREMQCPKSTKWNVINKEENSVLYEWQATPCGRWPDQHEIARILDGKGARYRIAYTVKSYQMNPDKRREWLRKLADVEVEESFWDRM